MSGAACLIYQYGPNYDALKMLLQIILRVKNALKPLCWYTCAIMTSYQYILIILGNFYIVSIWDLYGPETAVTWHSGRKNVVNFSENISAQ